MAGNRVRREAIHQKPDLPEPRSESQPSFGARWQPSPNRHEDWLLKEDGLRNPEHFVCAPKVGGGTYFGSASWPPLVLR
jgi:hypothetical protein